MAFVALKPCCFAGQRFIIGESIPDGIIHPGAAKNLLKMQVIAEHSAKAPAAICIHTKDIDEPLELTAEGLQAFVDILTAKAEEAETIISGMTDGDALILVHCCDGRKAVKAAAEARAKELNAEEGEQ